MSTQQNIKTTQPLNSPLVRTVAFSEFLQISAQYLKYTTPEEYLTTLFDNQHQTSTSHTNNNIGKIKPR